MPINALTSITKRVCSKEVASYVSVAVHKGYSVFGLATGKNVVPPGVEPGTFSVLTRCHDQLDHSTKLFLLLVGAEFCVMEESGVGTLVHFQCTKGV